MSNLSVLNLIRQRRSHRAFTHRLIADDDIRTLIEGAIMAPNHKMTQPWRFVVLGKLSRRRYAEIKAAARVRNETDADSVAAKREKIAADTAAVPAVIVVLQKLEGDAVRREEDYAAIYMGIQNMLLIATSMRLGSKIHTGSLLNDVALRELVKAADDERIVAILHVGEPAEELQGKPRTPAVEKTSWLP